MLVLSRKVNTAVTIGPEVIVKILGVTPSGIVKIGIEAPRGMKILREEVVGRTAALESVPAEQSGTAAA